MKKSLSIWIIVLLAIALVNAGRVSELSGTFMLREQPDAAHPGALLNAATEPFSLAVRPDPYGNTVAFQLKGALSSNAFTIRIYGLNGRVMDVLSGLVHSGSAMAVWRGPALSNGLLFATVRSGRNAKTVKFVLFK